MSKLNNTQNNDNLIGNKRTKNIYTHFEGFAGIGAQACALRRIEKKLFIKFKSVGIAEFDDKPVRAYEALNGAAKNYGDITKIDWSQLPHIDIVTWSSPCQDVSTAGKGKGLVEGSNTRSSLAWELMKLLDSKKDDLPSLILFENVKGILQKPHKDTFLKFVQAIEQYGYRVSYQVLDANDYGTAQHRERLFCVCTLEDSMFEFPKPRKEKVYLRDILEKNVGEKYDFNSFNPIQRSLQNGNSRTLRIHNPTYCDKGYTLTTHGTGRTEDNYIFRKDISTDPVIRVKDSFLKKHGVSYEKLISTQVRSITEIEAMRLMGFNDEEIERLNNSGLSKTAMYKCVGNSICPPVLEDIFYAYFKQFTTK